MPQQTRHRHRRRQGGYAIVLATLAVVLACSWRSGAHEKPLMSRTTKIALGDETSAKALLAEHAKTVRELLALVKDRNTTPPGVLLAVEALGQMRAATAAPEFVAMLGRKFPSRRTGGASSLTAGMVPGIQEAFEEALVSIGVPAREAILAKLGQLDPSKHKTLDLNGVHYPLKVYRPTLVNLLVKIEGKECAEIRIQLAMQSQKSQEKRKALKKALDLLRASARTKPTGKKSVHLNPITTRDKIIEENMRRLRSLRADAKFMSRDQEEAIGILATYRSTEAAPKLVEIIMVKRRARKPSSSWLIAGASRTRFSKPSEYPAVAALVSIGLPSVWAIRDNLDTFSKAQPEVKRVELYAEVILAVFPSNLVRALGAEMKEGTHKKSKHAYDKLLKLPDMNPPRIRIQREPDLEAFP